MLKDIERVMAIKPENRGKLESVSAFLYEKAGISVSPAHLKFALMCNNLEIQISGLRKG